jgi:hypothetical protein
MSLVFMSSGGIPIICATMFAERPPMSGVVHLAICRFCVTFVPSASRTTTTVASGRASFFALWLFSIPCSGSFLRFEALLVAVFVLICLRFLLRLLWPAEAIEVAPVIR